MALDQLGRNIFARGVPEDVTRRRDIRYEATLLDLMRAYARIRTRDDFRPYAMDRENIFTMEQALDRLRGLIGYAGQWADLTSFLPDGWDASPPAAALPPPPISPPFWNWPSAGRSSCASPKPSPPSKCAGESRERPGPADPHDPIERSLFEAPPMGEQERMVEAVLFASAEPVTLAELIRAPARRQRPGRSAGDPAPPV